MTGIAVHKLFHDRKDGHFMPEHIRSYSRPTRQALSQFGKHVRLARKTAGMTERELAERVGIARSTLQLIEKGDPRVEIGLAFQAAVLVGLTPFDPGMPADQVEDKLARLPHSIRRRKTLNDDF